jgi:ubiquinone/menaquinone biosynthesis C-methylase UbiE
MSTPDLSMQHYYAARAGEYDDIYLKPERQSDLRAVEAWLPTRFRDKQVIEVACGTGYWTQFIAPVAASVVAVDTAPETLELARVRPGLEQVQFLVGDAYALQGTPASFDAAFAGFWFSHVPVDRRREFLSGLCRVMRPGSIVTFIDNRCVVGSSTPISERDAEGNTFQIRKLNQGAEYRVIKNFPSRPELEDSVAGIASGTSYREWEYFWSFAFVVAGT